MQSTDAKKNRRTITRAWKNFQYIKRNERKKNTG